MAHLELGACGQQLVLQEYQIEETAGSGGKQFFVAGLERTDYHGIDQTAFLGYRLAHDVHQAKLEVVVAPEVFGMFQ